MMAIVFPSASGPNVPPVTLPELSMSEVWIFSLEKYTSVIDSTSCAVSAICSYNTPSSACTKVTGPLHSAVPYTVLTASTVERVVMSLPLELSAVFNPLSCRIAATDEYTLSAVDATVIDPTTVAVVPVKPSATPIFVNHGTTAATSDVPTALRVFCRYRDKSTGRECHCFSVVPDPQHLIDMWQPEEYRRPFVQCLDIH